MRARDALDAFDDACDAAVTLESDDDGDDVVYSQRDVREMNARALREGTLETKRGAFVRGFVVGDPSETLRRAFKSPFPNAPDRSGAWTSGRG